jgi:hypothetical protein
MRKLKQWEKEGRSERAQTCRNLHLVAKEFCVQCQKVLPIEFLLSKLLKMFFAIDFRQRFFDFHQIVHFSLPPEKS